MAVSIEEALERIYSLPVRRRREFIPIESACGRILADDLVAVHNLPPYDNSAMDGYAVVCADAGTTVEEATTIFAGDKRTLKIIQGEAARIMTGARLPEGTECIVPIEDVTVEGRHVTLPDSLAPGRHIRLCGEDIEAGEVLLERGEKLSAHHITLLASQGISHVGVYQKPRVALFASGNELKMHFETVQAHQLYNTNTPTFAARAGELDCDVHFIGTAADTLDDLLEHIEAALQSDLVITSGGVSVGDADYTREAFGRFDFVPLFEKVDVKPGKPTTVGTVGNTFVLNLPGNPLAAALNFELFGQALITHLSGTSRPYQHTIAARLAAPLKLRPGRRTLIPGFFDGERFTICDKFAPGMISPLARSNGFIMVDERCGSLETDAPVRVIPTRFIWRSDRPVPLTSG